MVDEKDGGNGADDATDKTDYDKLAEKLKGKLNIPEAIDVAKLTKDISESILSKIPKNEPVDVEKIKAEIATALEGKLKAPEVDLEAIKTKIREDIKVPTEDELVTKVKEALKPAEVAPIKVKADLKTAAALILGKSLNDVAVKEGEE